MALTPEERAVVDEIARREDDLVALASTLVAFDTTAKPIHEPPGDEEALQRHLAERLERAGAEIDLWQPAPDVVAGSRQVPAPFGFEGRPQLAARFPGTGRGPSLLFNGHIDVVPAGDPGAWTSPPFTPEVRDGRLHGRGACDMKGGVAAMVVAAEAAAARGLAGDLTVCTVTDEEATGAGAIAAVARGVRADAGLVAEPTGFEAWVACRGDVIARIKVPGRLGHAGIEHDEHGAVNAVDKARLVMDALAGLHASWRDRPDHQHEFLSPGHAIPTVISGGDWPVNIPDACELVYHVAYLPAHADADGWGTHVEQEVEACVARAAQRDPWLARHPPRIEWVLDIPAAEVPGDADIVETALRAGADAGRPSRRAGLDSWHDGATFTRFGGTPAIAFGPGSIDLAHAVDEHVPVADLVACAQAYALAALRHCDPGRSARAHAG